MVQKKRSRWILRRWIALGVMAGFLVGVDYLRVQAHAQLNREPPVPLPGLTTAQLDIFENGRALFEKPFRPREGLGPAFNARTCRACHNRPTIGGHGPGYRSNMRFNNSVDPPGVLFHNRTILDGDPDSLPDSPRLSKRRPTSLLGLGLIDAIPGEAILAHADPHDTDGDGIRGRPAIKNEHVLRFGSQAQVDTLFDFVADALHQEMGLTSPLPGFEQESEAFALPWVVRGRIDQPNVSLEIVQTLTDFVAMLAPPPREQEGGNAGEVSQGERIFREAACSVCHVPSYRTNIKVLSTRKNPSPVVMTALLDKEIQPYSDFLLHNLGPALDDGVALGVARTFEYKTPPLWGLRSRQRLLLHDGRASSIEQAILFHGGEAARSRNYALALPRPDRQALMAFLKSL